MRITIPTPPDFSLQAVLHSHGWRHLAPFTPDDDAGSLTRIERLPNGRVVEFTITATDNAVIVTSHDDVPAEAIAASVTRILQLDHSLAPFHAFCATRPELSHVPIERLGRFLCSPCLFEDAVKVLLTMNTTWAQTKAMTERIVGGFGSPLRTDPSLRAFPTAEQIAGVPFETFMATARVGYRAKALYGLANDVADGTIELEALRDRTIPADTVYHCLLSIHGVGPYGAACLMLYLGRGDRVNVDSWARTLLSEELGRPVSDKDVVHHFAGYGEWKGFAYNFYRWKHRSDPASSDVPF